jgi:hypothetical protein
MIFGGHGIFLIKMNVYWNEHFAFENTPSCTKDEFL